MDSILNALQQSEEKVRVLENIMDSIPSMIGYWDHNLRNQYCNRAYQEYFGKQRSEIDGKHIREVIGEVLYEKNKPFLERAVNGEQQSFERDIPLPGGGIRSTQAHYIPDRREGKIHGFFVLVFDVTPLKIAAHEKEKLVQKLSETYKMVSLGEMAGGVAHEINTPLAVISMNAQMASEYLEAETPDLVKIGKFVSTINKTTTRISKIVTGLLLFSKDRKGERTEVTTLGKLIDDTTPFCYERFVNHGIQCVPPTKNTDLSFECRPHEISQVLINLLNNAHDAVLNSENKWISIEGEDVGDFVQIAVTDSGPGMSEETREKIMQPFFTTKEVGKGTGLGLSISTGIVENHGGTLFLDLNSKNTRFVIRLPKSQSK